jgi:hypothetical protein
MLTDQQADGEEAAVVGNEEFRKERASIVSSLASVIAIGAPQRMKLGTRMLLRFRREFF